MNERGLLAELQARRDSLIREIAELQVSVAQATERLRQKQLTLESVLALIQMEGGTTGEVAEHRHFLEVAYDHLLQVGPLHYTRLCSDLTARGIFIPGAKPEANLLAHINRDRRFARIGRGLYDIVDRAKKQEV